ncbi:MAG: hypothetical protein F4W92_05425 [Gammaproteobacteria bacterium]|nr:hypothetical protein [Gammaproteobacteria bacterium]
MNKKVKSKIWTSLILMVICFVPFPTTFSETVDQETKLPVEFFADSSIHANSLAIIVTDDEVDLPVHLLPVYPSDETNLEFRLAEEETSAVVLLSESESQSKLPCNWEWWMFNTRDCDSAPPQTDGNTFSEDGNDTTGEEGESSNYTVAPNDSECLKNCRNRKIQSYRKVCVSYSLDQGDSESLKPHVWFKHGCTNCSPPAKKNATGSLHLDGLLLPAVGTITSANSLTWLNGNVRTFGFIKHESTHVEPTAKIREIFNPQPTGIGM